MQWVQVSEDNENRGKHAKNEAKDVWIGGVMIRVSLV
jgi:hypothetical protein